MKNRIAGTASAIVVCFLAFAPAATAQSIIEEARAGVLAQSCCGNGTNKEDGVSLNVEALFRSPRFLSAIGAKPLIGASVASDGDATSQIYAALEWRAPLFDRFFVAATLGGALHNGETDRFDPAADADRVENTAFYGCAAHFRFGGDFGYALSKRVTASVHYNHISNAGLCSENEGLDHLGGRLGIRF